MNWVLIHEKSHKVGTLKPTSENQKVKAQTSNWRQELHFNLRPRPISLSLSAKYLRASVARLVLAPNESPTDQLFHCILRRPCTSEPWVMVFLGSARDRGDILSYGAQSGCLVTGTKYGCLPHSWQDSQGCVRSLCQPCLSRGLVCCISELHELHANGMLTVVRGSPAAGNLDCGNIYCYSQYTYNRVNLLWCHNSLLR